jgi:hypothetical protein
MKKLFERAVFLFRLYEHRCVRIRVFPQRKKVLLGFAGLYGIAFELVGAGEAEMCKRVEHRRHSDAAVVTILWNSAAAAAPIFI